MIYYKRISWSKAVQTFLCFGLALFFVSIFIFSNISYAQNKVKGEWVLPKDYPADGFDGWGCIVSIEKNSIVIDEIQHKLSSGVEYHTPPGVVRSKSKFVSGAIVGYLKNPEREIISLWLIK